MEPAPNRQVVRFGVFELDLATRELFRNGRKVEVQNQPFVILQLLLKNPGQLVKREEIFRALWPDGQKPADYERSVNVAVGKLREILGDDAKTPRYVERVPKLGYRFIYPVTEGPGPPSMSIQLPAAVPAAPEADKTPPPSALGQTQGKIVRRRKGLRWVALVMIVIVLAAAGFYRHWGASHILTAQDTVVVAEFTNTTGDSVFDGTLRQGLSAQLEQSPFLNLLPDARTAETLELMTQPKDARLTPELAREVCQRTASAATIEGAIASLGNQYVLSLKALDCHSGKTLAEELVTANGKEDVIKVLGQAATDLRRKLGESLSSVEKYDAPLESLTTPSLEALKAYSVGYRLQIIKDDAAEAIPFYQRAIILDPSFTMAYEGLGQNYLNLGETARAAENFRKAYELRQRVSEREQLDIAAHYQHFVTGDLEAARKVYESWAQNFPHDYVPPTNLGSVYSILGEYGKALAADQEGLKLDPFSGMSYANLIGAYLQLNRLDDAKAQARELYSHNLDSPFIHLYLYQIEFLEHDAAGMEREAAGLISQPGYEDGILYLESDTAADAGQFAQARELTRRAAGSAQRAGEKETAASYQAEAALREVMACFAGRARQQAQAALTLSHGKQVEAISGIALGLAGDSAQALRLANDLARQFPKDTWVQFEYVPMIHAAINLDGRSGKPVKAVAELAVAAPYELGSPPTGPDFNLYPVYLRAEAYRAAQQGASAAAEYQKILEHPGVVTNEPIGVLAHLGLGRAYALQAGLPVTAVSGPGKQNGAQRAPLQPETLAKARAAYEDFFNLWKDADPDIPILKQAKAEYARL